MSGSEGLTTTQRGYGWQHQKLRAALLAAYRPSDLCGRCYRLLGPNPDLLDLGHEDGDKTQYRGLEHAACNRATGGRRGRLGASEPPRCRRTREEINASFNPLPCICGRVTSRCW